MMGVVCPVPMNACSGALLDAGNGAKRTRYHNDNAAVLRCEAKYLVSQGYTKLSSKMFRPPGGGEVLVLSRRPGARVRKGKTARSMGDFHEQGGVVFW